MADTIIVRDPTTGKKYEAPAGTPIPEGFEPIESKGPGRGIVDTVTGVFTRANEIAAENMPKEPNLAERLGSVLVPKTPGQAAQLATGGLGLAGRLLIPPAVEGAASLLQGEGPMTAATRSGVMLGAGGLGEGVSEGVKLGGRLTRDLATRGNVERAGAREAEALAGGMKQVMPESSPLLQRGSFDELLGMRDKVKGIVSLTGQAKEATEQQIISVFGDQRLTAEGLTMPALLDRVKMLNAAKRDALATTEPMKRQELIRQASEADAFLRHTLAARDPRMAEAYAKSVRDYDVALRFDEIAGAGTSSVKTNTERAGVLDTQAVRGMLQKERGRFDEDTYGPIFDAVNLGRGTSTTNVQMPWALRTVAPMPASAKFIHRPGAPAPAELPPNLMNILFGKALGSFNQGP